MYLVCSAEAVEVVDVERTEINLHGVEHVAERNSVGLRLFAVHMRIDLWHVNVETGEHAYQAWRLIACLQGGSRFLIKRLQAHAAPIFNLHLNPAYISHSFNTR